MKEIAFAGSGELVEKLIVCLKPNHPISCVVLSNKMPSTGLESMIILCKKLDIPIQYKLDDVNADIILTPNYPVLISKEFSDYHLCINAHFALLPRYRGFHPVQCALLNDEPQIGYTVHKIDAGMDSGPIYFQTQFEVTDIDNIHTLNSRMSDHLLKNFPTYLAAIVDGKQPIPQDDSKAIWCGRRHPEDGLIDWNKTSRYLFNLVRCICPPYYPGAYSFIRDKRIIISETEEQRTQPYHHTPGQIVDSATGRGLLVKTGDTLLWLKRVIVDGIEGPAEEIIGRRIGLRFTGTPLSK